MPVPEPHLAGQAHREVWRGLECTRVELHGGDSIRVSDFGGQVLSWVCNGQERLFVSPAAVLDGSAPIRGGIPICFPQFNQRGPLPKHGLARIGAWQFAQVESADGSLHAQWHWRSSSETLAQWPHAFFATLHVHLRAGKLQVTLEVENTGDVPWPFTAALHTYLRTEQVDACSLAGLEQRAYWDAAQAFSPAVQRGAVTFGSEIDRVYAGNAQPLVLTGALPSTVTITQDELWGETVVWNPGPVLCATLADMEQDSWQHMLCVEAAHVNQPVALLPGQRWRAGQTLQVQ